VGGGVGRPRAVLRRGDRVRRVARGRAGRAPAAAFRGAFEACWWCATDGRDRRVLTLAFDTATAVATSALVDDGEVLREVVPRASPATRPFPRPALARARPGRGDRTALPARARRATEHRLTTIELRRLALSDLRAIEQIERRSYPTPWSRSMFAGELAKPSSI